MVSKYRPGKYEDFYEPKLIFMFVISSHKPKFTIGTQLFLSAWILVMGSGNTSITEQRRR